MRVEQAMYKRIPEMGWEGEKKLRVNRHTHMHTMKHALQWQI